MAAVEYPTFTFETTAEEVADTFAEQIRGKNVLITGTSVNGIGNETARVIAKYANLVILTGHNEERLKLAEEAIKTSISTANTRTLIIDLSSLASVRKAAAEASAYPEPIHVLIHNAAAGLTPFTLTVDGYEAQMATGHLASFLFTKLLAPKLLASKTAEFTPRVVWVSSSIHVLESVNFELLKTPDATKYTPIMAYAHVKSATVLTAGELGRRSKGAILGYSVHPGVISTNINQAKDAIPVLQAVGVLDAEGKPDSTNYKWKTIPQGAATTVAAAFDPRILPTPGAYLDDSKVAEAAAHSTDPATAAKLWTATEEIVGEKFEF
uniref:Short-chain dehydrogenase/reductase family protein n=1 Tax=Mycena chlorophos TaxID=658473 RepID=A0ABQ0LM59_MYCCL|nr:short-chain dehydrogenase/reductase family protein [Mycena chlorophos]